MCDQAYEQPMPPISAKAALWEKVDRLNPRLQQLVVNFINALLERQLVLENRDKNRLLQIETWSEADIQLVEEAQWRRNHHD